MTNGPKSVAALVLGLEAALFERDIATGFRLLHEALPANARSRVGVDLPISLMLCVAQWVDLGYRDLSFLETLASANPHNGLATLTFLDYLKDRMVDGYRMLATERLEEAIDILAVVLKIGHGVLGDYLLFLANFWKGRAHRKLGDYEHAART